jgi:hypothetical protein
MKEEAIRSRGERGDRDNIGNVPQISLIHAQGDIL